MPIRDNELAIVERVASWPLLNNSPFIMLLPVVPMGLSQLNLMLVAIFEDCRDLNSAPMHPNCILGDNVLGMFGGGEIELALEFGISLSRGILNFLIIRGSNVKFSKNAEPAPNLPRGLTLSSETEGQAHMKYFIN
jgi:hypothetical protein